jgi:hypothetical protein
MLTLRRAISAGIAVASTICLSATTVVPSASASSDWSSLQSSVSFTVYEPYETYGMTRTTLEINDDCSPGDTVLAVYKASGNKKIKLFESDTDPCFPPNGSAMNLYVPVKSFSVQDGAGTAQLWMDCRTALQCEFPSNELIKTLGAWIKVPLEADAPHDPTYAYVYTKNISYKKIKNFVWSLGLP